MQRVNNGGYPQQAYRKPGENRGGIYKMTNIVIFLHGKNYWRLGTFNRKI